MRSPWPANSCKRRQPWIGEKGHLERDIAVIGGHKIIPGKDFHFSPVYASALPSPARPRQKVLTVSSRPDVYSFGCKVTVDSSCHGHINSIHSRLSYQTTGFRDATWASRTSPVRLHIPLC